MRAWLLAMLGGCSFTGSATDDALVPGHDSAPSDTTLVDTPSPACVTSAAYTTRPGRDHRYRATESGSFDNVTTRCLADGAHLVVIDDEDENTYVASLADAPYIGFDDLDTEHGFRWGAGTSAFTKWNGGEPNDSSNNEDCAHLLSSTQGYRWNDAPCSQLHAGVCECEPGYVAPPLPACTRASDGIAVNGRTYFVHTTATSWVAAAADCAATGAYLVVPSDDTENGALDNPGPLHVMADVWIGLSRVGDVWAPVDRAPPGYTNWRPQAPYPDPTPACVVLNSSNGKWENQECASAHPYVCECDPSPP